MKRIFIDVTGIVSFPTGLGKYSLHLLKALLAQSDFSFTVLHQSNLPKSHELFSIRNDRIEFLSTNIPVIGPNRDCGLFKIRRKINSCDLFHCFSSYLPAFGIAIPCVLTVHDLKYLLFPEFFRNSLKRWYYTWIICRGARRAEQIIAVSKSTKRDLVRLAVPAEKITVIQEASTIAFSGDTVDVGLPDAVGNKPFFLFVGDNRPHKNIARIIEAYTKISNELDEGCPSFVFAGPNFENLAQRYARDKENKGFIFLGSVNEDLLVTLYKRAVVLVYPSLYEGFGLPILEAMSLGTPVITSNCSSMPEVAGDAAIVIDPHSVSQLASAMITVLEKSSVRKKLKKMGLQRAQHFSWERAARMTYDVYENVLSRKYSA